MDFFVPRRSAKEDLRRSYRTTGGTFSRALGVLYLFLSFSFVVLVLIFDIYISPGKRPSSYTRDLPCRRKREARSLR